MYMYMFVYVYVYDWVLFLPPLAPIAGFAPDYDHRAAAHNEKIWHATHCTLREWWVTMPRTTYSPSRASGVSPPRVMYITSWLQFAFFFLISTALFRQRIYLPNCSNLVFGPQPFYLHNSSIPLFLLTHFHSTHFHISFTHTWRLFVKKSKVLRFYTIYLINCKLVSEKIFLFFYVYNFLYI